MSLLVSSVKVKEAGKAIGETEISVVMNRSNTVYASASLLCGRSRCYLRVG
jgi:hypothetical protein